MVDHTVSKKRRLSNGMLRKDAAAHTQERLEELIKRFDAVGESIIQELPALILDLEERVPKVFTRTEDIVELEDAFAKKECSSEGIQSGKPNPVIVEVSRIVTKEFDRASDKLSRLQRYVLMHVPREEDGNNFGVEVQAQFNGKLGEYLKWCDDTQDENKVYHQARAEIIRQMDFERAVEEKETMCEKEDKVTKSKATKSVENVPQLGDLLSYVARHDALQYFTLKNELQELISMYLHCYMYVKHNYEKIRWPRGKSDGMNMQMY
ncbi:hypothetical protein Pmar_PMAR019806 [Perkinsus marinus ATCC 50983]|uniref:Proteasome activator PA28 C-terminal domain-containing protein n=1 Tax=Perkinsus marinus (strain ATCC 50983 / TXsc) TaxID=423536 RepID=C5LRJ4_PERM5|nr:hypothetical protein Pmar_PMAR019806 [Perkinsus marinus ATCC 50983]EER00657.1 hypothetical protein Pmar_PMAR019806 [Perkinsus marinus ATCC 50983]|eukprot:XP_002767939.1 hypothetical protein Pmar_PMAR019806 [Perkinsus marinus ATCC 50983]